MIPKIIHYCWFGRSPLPDFARKCISSWKKHCPTYEIIQWDEDNFDFSTAPRYVRQACEAKKWAYVTDWVRLKVIYDHGGVYLDTDVQLIKGLDTLLKYNTYFGFENGIHIATGLGFGSIKGAPILKEIMEDYNDIPFILPDGSFDSKTCPVRNTEILLRHGLSQDNSKQILQNNILILPSDYLCPINYQSGKMKKTAETISIHWFSASWMTQQQQEKHKNNVKAYRQAKRKDWLIHLPNRILMALIGKKRYDMVKNHLKRGE